MPLRFYVLVLLVLELLLSACGGNEASPNATSSPSATAVLTPAPRPSATPLIASSPSPTPAAATIIGTWHRTILCPEARAAFAAAGMSDSEWLGDCQSGNGSHAHSHFFTAQGQFGSTDPGGVQVDDGDFRLVDGSTLEFPSHSREFGYDPILVTFTVADGELTFDVHVPSACEDKCRDAYGWALSAFGTNPWTPGGV